MRRPVVTLAVLLLVLTGCTPGDEVVVPDPEPTVEPMFATDEEALAAAEEAYGAYLAASDAYVSAAEPEPSAILEVVSKPYADETLEELDGLRSSGIRTSGATAFDSLELQQVATESDGSTSVVIYVCMDVSGVRVLDGTGADVTPTERRDRLPLEVELVTHEFGESLLVNRSELWSGDDFC